MEMGGILAEEAYQQIKEELKELKKVRKSWKKEQEEHKMSNISDAHHKIGKTFGIPLKSLGLGTSQTLKKCGKKWMKLNH